MSQGSRASEAGTGNAALYFEPEPYDASRPDLMGRHSAGQGFLTGFLRHADAPSLYLWNVNGQDQAGLEALVERLGPASRPVTWLQPGERGRLAEPGAVHFPWPMMQREAWARRSVGANRYSLTAVTHTIAEHYLMDEIAGLLLAPVEPWDALICTSASVLQAVRTQLDAVAEHLAERLDARRMPAAQLAVIPLGVHTDAFGQDPGERKRWRERLGIDDDAPVAVFVGRFNASAKMHPGPMGLALQGAATQLGRPVHWVLLGSGHNPEGDAAFRAAAAAFCPDVRLHYAQHEGPPPHTSIWSVADLFISFSDNVQESFGLTPLEAMASSLPCVVSDWNGYRDTVRHGVDGFRIRTTSPRPGLGADLAYGHAYGFESYGGYAGAAAQFVAVDVEEGAKALATLFADADLRRRMGQAARARAVETFDWKVVIGQHQLLWAELERRRLHAPQQAVRSGGDNPWRLDPFRMFAGHATGWLSRDSRVELSPGVYVEVMLAAAGVRLGEAYQPTADEARALVARLAVGPTTVGALVDGFPAERRPFLERGLLWLAKYGVVRIG